jgi:O-antigen ligase
MIARGRVRHPLQSLPGEARLPRHDTLLVVVATWFVAAFVFSIPYENGITVAAVGSLARLLGVAAIAVTAASAVYRGQLLLRPPGLFLIVVAAYALWSILTVFWSVDASRSVSTGATLVQLLAMAWMIHQLAGTERRRALLAQAFVLGAYAMIVLAMASFIGSTERTFREVGGIDPNYFATGCAVAIPFAWGLAIRAKTRMAFWVNAIYPVFAVVAVVLAASRGGLFTVLVAILVIPLTATRLSFARRALVLIALTAFTWAVFVLAPQTFPELQANLERLEAGAAELEGGTFTGRTTIWQAGFEAWKSAPTVGYGAGIFAEVTHQMLGGQRRSAHNGFLSIAVGSGLIGLTLYLALFAVVTVGVLANRERRWEHLVMILTLLVALLPVNIEHTKSIWFILSYLAASRPIVVTPVPEAERGARPRG